MSRRWLSLLALIAAFAIFVPALHADHGHGRDKDNGRGNHGRKDFRHDDHGRDHDHGRAMRDDGPWEHRGHYEYRSYDRDGRPPGWMRGRKVSWNYCGLPPGQARKYGCWSYLYQGRRYYYYHDDDDRIVIRRPTVIIHAGVDIVQ